MPSSRQARKSAKKSKVTNENLDPEKRKKLKALLKDFDCAVKAHRQKWDKECAVIERKIQGEYQSRLFALPQRIREMPYEEFIASSRQPEPPLQIGSSNQSSKTSKCTPPEFFNLGSQPHIPKENSASCAKQAHHLKNSTQKSGPSRSFFKTLQNEIKTPVVMLKHLPNIATPKISKHPSMVTPKFDSRQPLTPALLRKPRVGEVIMSMAGSPLQNVSDMEEKPGVLVSLGSGKVVSITENTGIDGVEEDLDQETKSSLLLVQKKLNELLQKHGT